MDSCNEEDITIDGDLNIESQLLCNPFFGILPLEYSDSADMDTVCVEAEMEGHDSVPSVAILRLIDIKLRNFKLIHDSNRRIVLKRMPEGLATTTATAAIL